MRTVTAAEARNQLGDLLGEVAHAKAEILITRRGKAIAKIVPVNTVVAATLPDPLTGLVRQSDGTYRNPEGIEDDGFFAAVESFRGTSMMETARDPFAS